MDSFLSVLEKKGVEEAALLCASHCFCLSEAQEYAIQVPLDQVQHFWNTYWKSWDQKREKQVRLAMETKVDITFFGEEISV